MYHNIHTHTHNINYQSDQIKCKTMEMNFLKNKNKNLFCFKNPEIKFLKFRLEDIFFIQKFTKIFFLF